MTQQPLRRRRILDQSTELSLDPVDQPTPVAERRRRVRDQSDDLLSEPSPKTEPPQADPSPDHTEIVSEQISSDYVNNIRAELLEDFYHDDFAESDYWEQSHEWSWGLHPPSEDYQHFLGRFE